MDKPIIQQRTASRPGRFCVVCAVDISQRGRRAYRCNLCQEKSARERERQRRPQRLCNACGVDISWRGGAAIRCVSCQKASIRERARRRIWKRFGITTECVDCGADTSGPDQKGSRRRCRPCQDTANEVAHRAAKSRYASKPENRQTHRERQSTPEALAQRRLRNSTQKRRRGGKVSANVQRHRTSAESI